MTADAKENRTAVNTIHALRDFQGLPHVMTTVPADALEWALEGAGADSGCRGSAAETCSGRTSRSPRM